MDPEHIIAEIEQLESIFAAPELDRSAQATSRLPIEGTTKCSRTARGFGCGSGMGFVAEPSPQCFD